MIAAMVGVKLFVGQAEDLGHGGHAVRHIGGHAHEGHDLVAGHAQIVKIRGR